MVFLLDCTKALINIKEATEGPTSIYPTIDYSVLLSSILDTYNTYDPNESLHQLALTAAYGEGLFGIMTLNKSEQEDLFKLVLNFGYSVYEVLKQHPILDQHKTNYTLKELNNNGIFTFTV